MRAGGGTVARSDRPTSRTRSSHVARWLASALSAILVAGTVTTAGVLVASQPAAAQGNDGSVAPVYGILDLGGVPNLDFNTEGISANGEWTMSGSFTPSPTNPWYLDQISQSDTLTPYVVSYTPEYSYSDVYAAAAASGIDHFYGLNTGTGPSYPDAPSLPSCGDSHVNSENGAGTEIGTALAGGCGAFVYSGATGTELLTNLLGDNNQEYYAYRGWDISDNGYLVGDGSTPTSAYAFLAYPSYYPAVSSVSSDIGQSGGGDFVTISGQYFNTNQGGTKFYFGGVSAAAVHCSSTTTCTAITPPGSDGTVQVTAVTDIGDSTSSADYTYTSNPIVRSVSPPGGPLTGGQSVTLTGSGFDSASSVTFDLANGQSVSELISPDQVQSDSVITNVITPNVANDVGTNTTMNADVRVTATTGEGLANQSGAQYVFGVPVVTQLDHHGGPGTGGDTLVVTGSGFSPSSTVNFVMQSDGNSYSETPTTVNAAGTSLTVTTPNVSSSGELSAAGTAAADVEVQTGAGTSPANPNVDTYTFGCQQQDLSDAAWTVDGCLSTTNPNQYQGSAANNPQGIDLSGLTVMPSASSNADINDGSPQGNNFASSGAVGIKVPGTGSLTQFYQGLLNVVLTGAPKSIPVAANTNLAGFALSGAMTLTPQGGGSLKGSVSTTLPGVLGGGPASLTFTTTANTGITSMTIKATKATLANLFTVTNLKIAWTNAQGWTVFGVITTPNANSSDVTGSLVYKNGQISTAHLTVSSITLAHLITINNLTIDYGAAGWAGSATVAQGTGGGTQQAAISLKFDSTTQQMVSGSLHVSNISLFGVVPLKLFNLDYSSGTWNLSVESNLPNGTATSGTLQVTNGAITGASFDLQNAMLGVITLKDFNLSYAGATNTYTASIDASLPEGSASPISGLTGKVVWTNGQFVSGKLGASGSIPIADGVFLTYLEGDLTLSPYVIVSGTATVSLGPKSASFASVTGTLTYTAAHSGTPESVDVNGTMDVPALGKIPGGSSTLGNGDVNINSSGVGSFCVALGAGSASAAPGGGPSCTGSSGLGFSTKYGGAKVVANLYGSFDINGNLQAQGSGTLSGSVTLFGHTSSGSLTATAALNSHLGFVACAGTKGVSYTWGAAGVTAYAPPLTAACSTSGFVSPPSASDPPPPTNETTGAPGSTVNLTGSGFFPGEPVRVSLDGSSTVLAVATATTSGDVAVTVTIPPGTPGGQHQFVLTGLSSELSAAVDVYVTSAGAAVAPVFTSSSPPLSAVGGAAYQYQFAVTSPSDAPVFSLASDAPSWLTIDPLSGVVSGTEPGDETSFSYTVVATNDEGATDAGPFTVTVTSAPVFSSDSPPLVQSASGTYQYQFVATGSPDAPTFGLNADAPSWLSIDPATGIVSGTEPGDEQTFTYSVTATNDEGSTTVGPFNVVVQSDEAPTWTADDPPTSLAAGATYDYTFQAAGFPAPTYVLAGDDAGDTPGPSWLSIDATTGEVTGTPPSGTTSFAYDVLAENTDSGGDQNVIATGLVTVDVGGPTFSAATPADSMVEGDAYSYQFLASDPLDGTDAVTYALDPAAPSWLSIDPTGGYLYGVQPADGSTAFTYSVIATDANGSTTVGPFTVSVDGYVAPSWTADIPPTSVLDDATYSYQFQADGTPAPTYSVAGSLSGATPAPSWISIDPATGILTATPPTGVTSFSYAVFATSTNPLTNVTTSLVDGPGLITVAVTQAPVFSADSPPTSVAEGGAYAYRFSAAGAPDPPTYALADAPTWLTINATTGAVSGTEPATGETAFSYSVIASNAEGQSEVGPFSVAVISTSEPAQFTEASPPLSAATSIPYAYQFDATGYPDAPTFTLAGAHPSWLTVNAATGSVAGTAPVGTTSFTYEVTATDAAGSQTVGPFTVTVVASSAPAFVAPAPAPTVAVGDAYDYQFTATGVPAPRFTLASGAPTWLSIDPDTGLLSGTAPAGSAGTHVVTVDLANGVGAVVTYSFTLVVQDVPAAPTDVVATATVTGALVSWNPSSTTSVTGYVVTASPGGASVRVGATTDLASFTSLSAGVAYTFTVTAISNGGASAPALSGPVVPTATSHSTVVTATSTTAGGVASVGPVTSPMHASVSVSAHGVGTVSAAQYATDPVDALAGEASFFDVQTSVGNTFSSVTVTVCGAQPGDQLLWWDPVSASWEPAGSASGPGSNGCWADLVTASSSPSLADLYGTVFALEVAADAITSTSLPDATAGTAYHQTVATSGGTGAVMLHASGLPSWLTLSSQGVLTGEPTVADEGSVSFSVTATDANGVASAPQYLSITVDAPPVVTSTSLPAAEVGVAYVNQYVSTSGGAGPLTFHATGLPDWMTLSPGGVPSGTPTSADVGTTTFTVTATDANGAQSSSQLVSITVDPVPTLTSLPLPTGTAGQNYDQFLSASGGVGTVLFSSSDLPDWLSLSSAGELVGLPDDAGSYTFDVTTRDTNGGRSTTEVTLDVLASTPVVTLTLSTGEVTIGSENTVTLGVVALANFDGPIPTGTVTLSDGSGTLCTATLVNGYGACTLGAAQIPVGVDGAIVATYNGDGNYLATTTGDQTLTVDPAPVSAPVFTSAPSDTMFVATPSLYTFTTSGYPLPSFTESGTLPIGVSFMDNGDGTAELVGTPVPGTRGVYPISVTATNGNEPDATQDFTLRVDTPLAFQPGSSFTFTDQEFSSDTIATTGNAATTTFAVPANGDQPGLPSWLTLTNNGDGTATLSGTPPAPPASSLSDGVDGVTTFTLDAYDGVSPPISETVTITVASAPVFTSDPTVRLSAGEPATVYAAGYPVPTLATYGTWPAGFTLSVGTDGYGVINTDPSAPDGIYPVTVAATNDLGTTLQTVTLIIGETAGFTSPSDATFAAGTGGSFTVTTTGFPSPALSVTGTLPDGVTFADNGDGTATLDVNADTPVGTSDLTFTSDNGFGAHTQAFTLTVSSLPTQTVSFTSTAPTDPTAYGASYSPVATASSGLAVQLSIDPESTGGCSLDEGVVSFTSVGTCVIDADQPGNGSWAPADEVQQVLTIGPGSQTITFTSTAPTDATVNGPGYTVTASGGPSADFGFGNAVVFSADPSSAGVCTVTALGSVAFVGGGTCTIDANQSAFGSFLAAAQVTQSFTVYPATQSASWAQPAPTGETVGAEAFYAITNTTSGLPATVTVDPSSTPGTCAVAGSGVFGPDGYSTIVFGAPGTCVIDATQAGDASFLPAPEIQQSFSVAQGTQSIGLYTTPPESVNVGSDSYVIGANAGASDDPVTYSVDATSTPGACTVSATDDQAANNLASVQFTGLGTCVIDADEAGDADYLAAPTVSQSIDVVVGTQVVAFTSNPPGTPTVGSRYAASASGSPSGVPVVLSIDASSTGVCTIDDAGTVTFTAPGTCTIDADQAANDFYTAAPEVQQSMTVTDAQAITFTSPAPTDATVGGPAYDVTATGGGSGQPVTFSVDGSTTAVCSVAGATVTFTAVGTCQIDADQAAAGVYSAAPTVSQSFAVAPGSQTITFTSSAPSHATVGGAPYQATATGGASGAPVDLAIDPSSGAVCAIDGSGLVTFTGVGTCTIDATQAATADYLAAPPVAQSVAVGVGSQSVAFSSVAPTHVSVGSSSYFTFASATSGLIPAISLDPATSAGACAIESAGTYLGERYALVGFTGNGTCVLDASQAGDADYTAATTVRQSIVVGTGPVAPGPPLNVVATPANASATVSWQAPTSPGTESVSHYTVTSSPGLRTCTTTSTSCVVSGLTNGVVYTFTVTATSSVGTGPASAPSLPVRPGLASVTTVTLSTATATFGHEGTVRVSVRASAVGTGARATGQVTVRAGSVTLCTVTLSSGAGSCALGATALPAGATTLTAAFGGSATLASSTATSRTLTVMRSRTATSLHLSASTVTIGAEGTETLSVTVTPAYASSDLTGTVTVSTGSTTVCVLTLHTRRGTCTLAASQLAVGTHSLVATYAQTTDFAASTSPAVRLTVRS